MKTTNLECVTLVHERQPQLALHDTSRADGPLPLDALVLQLGSVDVRLVLVDKQRMEERVHQVAVGNLLLQLEQAVEEPVQVELSPLGNVLDVGPANRDAGGQAAELGQREPAAELLVKLEKLLVATEYVRRLRLVLPPHADDVDVVLLARVPLLVPGWF